MPSDTQKESSGLLGHPSKWVAAVASGPSRRTVGKENREHSDSHEAAGEENPRFYGATNRGTGDDPAVVERCRGCGGRRRGRGPTHSRATILAWLPTGSPGRPMSLVPRRSSGADRQSSGEPGHLGHKCLPHVLVRPAWAGQCRAKHFRGRRATASAASTAAGSQLLPDPTLVPVIR